MSKKHKGKVISYNFKKDVDSTTKSSSSIKYNVVIDLRKGHIKKMVDDLASLNKRGEDLMEG